MKVSRKHSHPRYIQWFKTIFAIFAFLYPSYMVLSLAFKNRTPVVSLIFLAVFSMICFLITAYFFQDIWVDQDGLIVEFLWTKMRVKWGDVEEIKSVVYSPYFKIVITKKLSAFHRIFGVLYGLTMKPSFIIVPTISDFETLRKEIEKNITKNKRK